MISNLNYYSLMRKMLSLIKRTLKISLDLKTLESNSNRLLILEEAF
jgi:hypothetical protein